MKVVWSAVIALGIVGAASANDDDGAKTTPRTYTQAEIEALQDLANRVLKLEELQQDAELEKLRKAAEKEKQADQESLPGRVGKLEKQFAENKPTWDASKMLSFSTPDGNFTAKIGGRLYVNYRNVFEGSGANNFVAPAGAGNPDSLNIDTARIQLDGTFYKDFIYRIEIEAKSGGSTAAAYPDGSYRLNDTWLGWQGLGDWLAIQAGILKVPFSQEETTSSRFIDFTERSIVNRIAPGRDLQVQLKGALFEKVVEWNAGVANGHTGRENLKFNQDSNSEKDLFVRLFFTPLKNSDVAFLKQLRVGVDYTAGKRDQTVAAPPAVSSGDLFLPGLFPAGAGIVIGDLSRTAFNFSWLMGPASLRAEFVDVKYDLNGAAVATNFHQTGWYVQATYLLTGEDKPLENRVKPFNNFSPLDGGWGAWELAARAAVLRSDGRSAGVYSAAQNDRTTEYTIGVNWWMTPNVALRINWERLIYDVDVPTGTNGALQRYEDGLYIRWQIDF